MYNLKNKNIIVTGSEGLIGKSIVNNLVQNVVCIAGRGEFYRSENATIDNGFDDVRISEIAIVSNSDPNDVLAIGKIDRQVIKKKNDFVIFDVQIVI